MICDYCKLPMLKGEMVSLTYNGILSHEKCDIERMCSYFKNKRNKEKMAKTYGDSEISSKVALEAIYNQRDIESIGKRLETIRNKKLISVIDMVALIGIANFTYVRIVNRNEIRKCTPKMIRKLLAFLDEHELRSENAEGK